MECNCDKEIKRLEDRLKMNVKTYSDLYNDFRKIIQKNEIDHEFLKGKFTEFWKGVDKYDNLFFYLGLITFINSILIIRLIYKVIFA